MSCGCGLEWSSKRPWRAGPRLLREILRFLRTAGTADTDGKSFDRFLRDEGYSESFRWHYLVPMTSALWSMAPQEALDFPASYGIEFFANHSMLGLRREPLAHRHRRQPHVRPGAARAARRAGAPGARPSARCGAPTRGVVLRGRRRRDARVRRRRRRDERAAGARAARGPLGRRARDPLGLRDDGERDRPPHRRDASCRSVASNRSSWNYRSPGCGVYADRPSITYSLNRLQRLDAPARVLRHAQPHGRHRSLGGDPRARVRASAGDVREPRGGRARAGTRSRAAHRLRGGVAGQRLPRGRARLGPAGCRRVRGERGEHGRDEERALCRHRHARPPLAARQRVPLPGLHGAHRSRRAAAARPHACRCSAGTGAPSRASTTPTTSTSTRCSRATGSSSARAARSRC